MPLATASVTATGSTVLTKSPHENFVRIQVVPAPTMSGLDYTVEGSIDGTNYAAIAFIDETLYANDADGALSSQSAAKSMQINGLGLQKVRVRVTAYSSGTAAVSLFSCFQPGSQTQVAGD